MAQSDIAVIIVNWKVKDLLKKCLDSILAYQKNYQVEILVVDNNSQDGSVQMIRDDYPMVHLLALEKNIGFGAANNLAIKQATAEFIFLLNPDTELTADFFDNIFNYAKNNPSVALIGPKIINEDGTGQESVRRFPDLWSQIFVLLKLKNILNNNRFLNRYLWRDFDYTTEQAVEQIMGAAMFIRRSALDKIGFFDTKFFIWFEEVDLCKRAQEAGLEIKYFPQAVIVHHGGKSFSQSQTLKKQMFFNKSLLYYFYKHKPFIQTIIIFLLIPLNIILTIIYAAFFQNKGK